MAYDFNKNFSQGYGRTGRLSFQGGGRAGTAFGLHSAGIKTQGDIEEEAAEQSKKMGWWDLGKKLAGFGAGLAGSYFLPGLVGLNPLSKGAALLKTLMYTAPKAATEAIASYMYKPKDFKSKTGFGLDKYAQLGERGEKFRQRGMESAGTGFLSDTLMAMMKNPFTGQRMGTPADTFGISPKEWGKYTPTAHLQSRAPSVMNQLQQATGQQTLGGGKLNLDLTGGTFTSPSPYSSFEGSLSGVVPSADVMHKQALQNINIDKAQDAMRNISKVPGRLQLPTFRPELTVEQMRAMDLEESMRAAESAKYSPSTGIGVPGGVGSTYGFPYRAEVPQPFGNRYKVGQRTRDILKQDRQPIPQMPNEQGFNVLDWLRSVYGG